VQTKYQKPPGCSGCPLEHDGVGFVPAYGPTGAKILLYSSHPGYDEAASGIPFVGAAGGMLTRLLNALGWTREQFRITNSLQCTPPRAEINKKWYRQAHDHCGQYRAPVLQQHPVILALGANAIRSALNLWELPSKHFAVEDFHGTVTQLESGQHVVGGFHPAQLQQGSHNLFQVACFDLKVAAEVAAGSYQPDPIRPIIDPPVEWFRQYVEGILLQVAQDPDSVWGVVDIETPDTRGKNEATLGEDDKSYTIIRVNFAVNGTDGVTVPYVEAYRSLIHQLIEGLGVTLWWNGSYDQPRLLKAGTSPVLSFRRRMVLDGMWLCKHLQSDVPMGLGFWAPFYSKHGAWKHLADSAPGEYASYDGPQTWRTVSGICSDLVDAGKWYYAHRHSVRLMENILRPATTIGLQVNRQRLDQFEQILTAEARRLVHAMQGAVPEDLLPLTPKGGYATPPKRELHTKATVLTMKGERKKDADDMDPVKMELYEEFAEVIERQERRMVYVCKLCGQVNVQKSHRCNKLQDRQLEFVERLIPRWYWREPFNPDSPDQWLAYIKARGHKPGRNKKTKRDSADRETLQRLARTTSDPVYQQGLDLRAVVKVRGTYAIGVRRHLDAHDRFHPEFTRRPSMFRISSVAPNITNVVADKGERKKSLAAGFRKCVVASSEPPAWWAELTPEQQQEYLG
jgi:uracil-DNA glycosylase family 4